MPVDSCRLRQNETGSKSLHDPLEAVKCVTLTPNSLIQGIFSPYKKEFLHFWTGRAGGDTMVIMGSSAQIWYSFMSVAGLYRGAA
jgi:hypothetical protein